MRSGYKKTEVEVIPGDWRIAKVGDVCQIFGRIGFRGYTINDIVKPGEGAITISPSNIQGNKTDFAKCTYISWAKYEESPEIKIEDGDILLVKTGSTVGKVAIVQNLPTKATINPQIVVLKKITINNVFLGYSMGFRIIQNQIAATVVGGALPTLSQSQVAQFAFPLPPTKAEQEAIARALSDADDHIESLEQLVAKKRNLMQGTMQELLTGKKRLPGFEVNPDCKQTEVGTIPDDWEVRCLGEIGKSLIGLTYKPTDVRSDGILVLRSSNIHENALRFDDNVFVEMDIPERIMMRPGDILICVRNGSRDLIGKCAHIDGRARGMTFGAFMAVFRSSFHNFVFHQYQSHLIKKQIFECLGATINQITNKSLDAFNIPLPPTKAEQEAIATILSDMDSEIAALEDKLVKSRQIKQGMMQELLTGRIRLI